jgi:hypothetical protein
MQGNMKTKLQRLAKNKMFVVGVVIFAAAVVVLLLLSSGGSKSSRFRLLYTTPGKGTTATTPPEVVFKFSKKLKPNQNPRIVASPISDFTVSTKEDEVILTYKNLPINFKDHVISLDLVLSEDGDSVRGAVAGFKLNDVSKRRKIIDLMPAYTEDYILYSPSTMTGKFKATLYREDKRTALVARAELLGLTVGDLDIKLFDPKNEGTDLTPPPEPAKYLQFEP